MTTQQQLDQADILYAANCQMREGDEIIHVRPIEQTKYYERHIVMLQGNITEYDTEGLLKALVNNENFWLDTDDQGLPLYGAEVLRAPGLKNQNLHFAQVTIYTELWHSQKSARKRHVSQCRAQHQARTNPEDRAPLNMTREVYIHAFIRKGNIQVRSHTRSWPCR